jgi:hypothetical protein
MGLGELPAIQLQILHSPYTGVLMRLFYKLISQLLIVSMILLPFSTQAGMIGTDQAVASAQDLANRDKVRDFVSRGEVVKQFEALGLNASSALDRVNAMTQQEVNQLAGKIDSLPVGADSGWGWAAAVIIIAVVIYLVWYK